MFQHKFKPSPAGFLLVLIQEASSLALKINDWKMQFPFGKAYFQVQNVSFRECNEATMVEGVTSWKKNTIAHNICI